MATATLTPTTGREIDHQGSVEAMKQSILHHLHYSVGVTLSEAGDRDVSMALGLAVRQHLIDAMRDTETRFLNERAKRVYYISMEFLIGKSTENNLINLQLTETCRQAVRELGVCWEDLLAVEPDAGLGNGGLGRLAACFIDSMATLGIPGYGYGINYEFGLFRQEINNGWQREQPDNWLTHGSPWQLERTREAVVVPLYGRVENVTDANGEFQPMWVDWQAIIGVPHDMPVVGYGAETVNYLRLYSACGSQDFNMELFNEGDYIRAVQEKIQGETISRVLYPSDAVASGRELRLIQEYFMVACCLRDVVRKHETTIGDIRCMHEYAAIQLNDTHPALAVVELMRILVDEKGLPWSEAWKITSQTMAYTNHTLLPEALEKWPVQLLGRVLPRHLDLIYEINQRFLDEVAKHWPGDMARLREMSIIDECDGCDKQIRMCNLAIVGSHSVNGVSQLHSDLVKASLVPRFHELWPDKFNNKTNGITPRRWLLQANPKLADLISEAIGTDWIRDLDHLRQLETHADDADFQSRFETVKIHAKRRLAEIIQRKTGEVVDATSLFDVQVKRIHQYKRQLLATIRIIHDYLKITEDHYEPPCPRTYLFAGKAAPGYWTAKQIIGLINQVGKVVNSDPRAKRWMKVVFLPNYRVSLAERIFPASDLSEQISTAGFEASGTGNMKFMLNGALTMGTLDGANVEMLEEVGADNIFIFGLKTHEIQRWYTEGGDQPRDYYHRLPGVRRIFDALRGSRFSPGQPGLFSWVYDLLVEHHDPYFHLADFESYVQTQEQAAELFTRRPDWNRQAILNVARAGKFSSDRTIREYAQDIWGVDPDF